MSDEKTPKVALITGAARRIGAAIARDLAIAGGWTVAIHYGRSGDDAEALAAEIEAGGGRAATFACDLMSEAATAALVGRVAERFGSVTCLVNNASVFERDEPDTATCESWARHMQVNLRAPFVLIQSLARQLPAGLPVGRASCVINLLDQRVWNLTPHFTSYTVSKMGLWTLTRTLAMALAPRIRVNAVGPGPTLPSARQTAEPRTGDDEIAAADLVRERRGDDAHRQRHHHQTEQNGDRRDELAGNRARHCRVPLARAGARRAGDAGERPVCARRRGVRVRGPPECLAGR